MQGQNFKKTLLQLMPHGIDWCENEEIEALVEVCAKEMEKAFFFGLGAVRSTPRKGYFKKNWEDLLQGAFINHKGIIDVETGILVTNTVPFFQKIISSFGLEKEITIKVTPTKEIHFMGAVLSERIPNPERPGESMFLRHEKFIQEVNKVRLAHIVVRYKSK